MPTIEGIFFDFDGTILDSFSSQFKAYQSTFLQFNIRITETDFLKNYSPNWLKTYRAFGLPEQRWKEADELWLKEVAKFPPSFFPEAKSTLRRLRRSFRLGLVTSGSKKRVLNDLVHNKAISLFDVIVTGDDVQKKKPDPQGLLMALEFLSIKASRAVYVGDAVEDLKMARAAHVRFVAVQSQFTRKLPASLSGVEEVTRVLKVM